MMNTTYETYMNALKQGLASFDSAAAEEILNDFESHFADARSQGLSDEEICAELGNVDDVLEFFRQEYATTEQPVANVLPQEKTHSNSEETHPNYPYAPSTAITAMEISLRNASADFAPGTSASVEFDFSGDFDPDRFEAGIEGNTFCLREKKLIPSVFWKHLFCNNHQKEVFSFQVPSTVQKLTLRSLNGATGLDTLSLTTLGNFRHKRQNHRRFPFRIQLPHTGCERKDRPDPSAAQTASMFPPQTADLKSPATAPAQL